MTKVDNLETLVTLAQAANTGLTERREAFGELVKCFQDMAYGCAYAVLGDAGLAQSTMIILALTVLALLCLALLGLSYWISGLLLYARRQPVTRSPADEGLAYEDVTFPSPDGLALKGWWIPAGCPSRPEGAGPAVILLHPLFGNRHGFSAGRQAWPPLFRADVNLLKTARGFHQAGYAVLLFDFRSHGESGCGLCAGGLSEDQDVAGAVDYVISRLAASAPAATPQVGLVGFGLGAAAALVAVGRERGTAEKIRIFSGDMEGGFGYMEIEPPHVKMLRFLVAVQPACLGQLVRGYLGQVAAPLSLVVVQLVDRLCRWRGGYPLGTAFLLKFIREVRTPVLYVQARPDSWGGCGEVQRLYDATPGPKQLWWIEAPVGRLEAYDYIGDHLEPVLAFAAHHVSKQSVTNVRVPQE